MILDHKGKSLTKDLLRESLIALEPYLSKMLKNRIELDKKYEAIMRVHRLRESCGISSKGGDTIKVNKNSFMKNGEYDGNKIKGD